MTRSNVVRAALALCAAAAIACGTDGDARRTPPGEDPAGFPVVASITPGGVADEWRGTFSLEHREGWGANSAPRLRFLGYSLDETGVRTWWLRIEVTAQLVPTENDLGELALAPGTPAYASVPLWLPRLTSTDELTVIVEGESPAFELLEATIDERMLYLRVRLSGPLRDHADVIESADIELSGPMGAIDCGDRGSVELEVGGRAFQLRCGPTGAVFAPPGS